MVVWQESAINFLNRLKRLVASFKITSKIRSVYKADEIMNFARFVISREHKKAADYCTVQLFIFCYLIYLHSPLIVLCEQYQNYKDSIDFFIKMINTEFLARTILLYWLIEMEVIWKNTWKNDKSDTYDFL